MDHFSASVPVARSRRGAVAERTIGAARVQPPPPTCRGDFWRASMGSESLPAPVAASYQRALMSDPEHELDMRVFLGLEYDADPQEDDDDADLQEDQGDLD